ncbi:hypothetical protein OZX60_03045 [Streptococcaceae bacterium ESL0687]|nr:hypothetical protein OZX60_03045 [Streptococcaceae bacterium ESL0687]
MNKRKVLAMTFAAGLLVAGLAGCSKKETSEGVLVKESDASISSTDVSGVEEISGEEDFSTVGEFKDVLVDGKNPKITSTYTFDVDYTNSSWDNVDFSIDKAKVVETDKFKEKDDEDEYTGALALHYKVKNTGDEEISIHPEDAVIVLKDGTEIKAKKFSTSLISKFKKGSKEGNIQFKFKKSESDDLANIEKIKVDFKGKVGDKDKVEYEYDVELAGNVAESVEESK